MEVRDQVCPVDSKPLLRITYSVPDTAGDLPLQIRTCPTLSSSCWRPALFFFFFFCFIDALIDFKSYKNNEVGSWRRIMFLCFPSTVRLHAWLKPCCVLTYLLSSACELLGTGSPFPPSLDYPYVTSRWALSLTESPPVLPKSISEVTKYIDSSLGKHPQWDRVGQQKQSKGSIPPLQLTGSVALDIVFHFPEPVFLSVRHDKIRYFIDETRCPFEGRVLARTCLFSCILYNDEHNYYYGYVLCLCAGVINQGRQTRRSPTRSAIHKMIRDREEGAIVSHREGELQSS